ncbi:MAG: SGNH/GDSL hydrolase family protein [Verrucomicrobiia bacterium]
MNPENPGKDLTMQNRRLKRRAIIFAIYFSILAIIFLLGCEIILRLRGFKPYRPAELNVKIEPGGKLFSPHPVLGYSHIAGKFKVTLKDGYSFNLTHLTNGLRATRPLDALSTGKPSIWIMGCSFAHGWSLNDDQTFPWLIQSALTNYDVLNFGVNGYGTVQSLYQFRYFLNYLPKPSIVVVTYAYFHDERNTFLRSWKKAIVPYNKLGPISPPYARFDKEGKLAFYSNPVQYTEFPLQRHSALVHFIEQKYNDFEDRNVKSHQVTKAVIETFANECKSNGIQFFVAGITRGNITADLLEFCKKKNIKSVDISVNLSNPENRNLPHDDHPGALANKQYAEKLLNYLNQIIYQSH